MLQTPIRICRRTTAAAMLAACVTFAASTVAVSQQVVAMVNGTPITALDIEHRTKLIVMSTHKTPSRQEVLDSLIDEILEIDEARRYSIEVPEAEVDRSFANVAARMGIDTEKLTQQLAGGGASAATFRHRLKAELAWTALVRGRYKSSLEVGETDIEEQLKARKSDDKNDVAYEYLLRPILLFVPRNSPDASYEARKHEAEALRTRFASCTEGVTFARTLKEVTVRDQVSKYSFDLIPQLRAILDGTEIGHLTPPERTAEGIQMFALCVKRETKADTPGRKEAREELFQKKFGERAKLYLKEIRRAAMIEYK